MADKCKECGCICKQCNKHDQKNNDMHLHVEIENLRQRLVERDNHIVTMETQFLSEAEKFPNGELASLKEEMLIWQDKYTRLYEAHKRVQKVNQNLEDKLLRIVDKCETEKGAFTKDIATLSHRLADANYTIHRLTQDNEKYRNDVNLAIQLLQCKPSNFVGQKYESLPTEVQAKVRTYVAQKGRNIEIPSPDVKSITVPISTFPPTAMVYNVAKPVADKQDANSDDDSKPVVDIVSAAIMAKVLEDRERERIFARHCNTCTCHRSVLKVDTETQTLSDQDEDGFTSTKDYFSRIDQNELKNTKNIKEYSQIDGCETNFNYSKGNSQCNDLNAKRTTFRCLNEVTECKSNTNSDNSKMSNRYHSNAKNYLNLKNSSKNKSTINESSIISDEDTIKGSSLNQCKKLMSEKKSTKEMKNFDDQAKIDMINERLWKSSWMNSKTLLNARENEVQLDVINERVWKNSSKSSDKPARLTVIEVKNADDQSEKTQTDPATSPSFSGDSVVISSSDPSSLSSDVVVSQTHSNNKKERIYGPRNCLMRVTPGSKNILLDNVGAYQTVLYTSGSSRPSTALVHVAKSSRSGRSASISSEENSPCSMHDNTHLQRVAEWVDTLSNDCNFHDQRLNASSEDPLLNTSIKDSSKLKDTFSYQIQDQRDLMTFEGSSDEEHKLTMDYDYQGNITEEMEETYLKLAASLDSASLQLPNSTEIDMMTIEKYRKEQKRSHKNIKAKFQSKT